MKEGDMAAQKAVREEGYEELSDEDLIEVEGEKHPPYNGEKEITGVRKIRDVEGNKSVKEVLDLGEKIEKFNEAMETSSGRQRDILKDQLDKLLEQRKEVTVRLNDDEVVQAGLGMQRAEELKVNARKLLQEHQTGNLNETDKAVLEGKIENITDRMKKIVDGFDEKQKENFTTGLALEQVKDLGLERQAIRRLDRVIKSHDSILKSGRPADRQRVVDNRNKLLAEREAIWESMSEGEKRQKYGIKTQEEFMGTTKKAKEQGEDLAPPSKAKKPKKKLFGEGIFDEEGKLIDKD